MSEPFVGIEQERREKIHLAELVNRRRNPRPHQNDLFERNICGQEFQQSEIEADELEPQSEGIEGKFIDFRRDPGVCLNDRNEFELGNRRHGEVSHQEIEHEADDNTDPEAAPLRSGLRRGDAERKASGMFAASGRLRETRLNP